MECRKLEVTIISANNLEDVRKVCKMKVYAKVTIGGKAETEKRTPTDKHGEIDPAWNFTMKYTIAESALEHHGVMLVIKLYCKRKLGDRYIGEVYASMKELFDHSYSTGGSSLVSYPVKKGALNSQGVLKFSYRFGECVDVEKLVLAEGFVDWTSLYKEDGDSRYNRFLHFCSVKRSHLRSKAKGFCRGKLCMYY